MLATLEQVGLLISKTTAKQEEEEGEEQLFLSLSSTENKFVRHSRLDPLQQEVGSTAEGATANSTSLKCYLQSSSSFLRVGARYEMEAAYKTLGSINRHFMFTFKMQ